MIIFVKHLKNIDQNTVKNNLRGKKSQCSFIIMFIMFSVFLKESREDGGHVYSAAAEEFWEPLVVRQEH